MSNPLNTEEDLDEIFGSVNRTAAGPGLKLVHEDPHRLPDPDVLANEQTEDALDRLYEDVAGYPRFPIPDLDSLAGALAPDELWIVGGRQGNGKTLFLQNFAGWMVDAGVPVLYMGTEQDPHVLRLKQACAMVGVPARLMLKPTPAEMANPNYLHAQKLVAVKLRDLDTPETRALLRFSDNRYISRDTLARWSEVACEEYGTRIIIVDHLHHMDHGTGRSPVDELTRTVHLAKDMAAKYHVTLVVAAQIKRTPGGKGNELKPFTPPAAEDFGGASAIERTADILFTLWRPLRTDLDHDTLKSMCDKAAMGDAPADTVFEPQVMGVRCVKDRLGDAPGKQCHLAVESGRLVGLSERDRYRTDYDSMSRLGRPK